MTNPIPQPVWADSEHFERLYIMWQPNDDLGILVSNEDGDDEPIVVFCSLFEAPDRVFYEGRDQRAGGVKLSELKRLVETIEEKIRLG